MEKEYRKCCVTCSNGHMDSMLHYYCGEMSYRAYHKMAKVQGPLFLVLRDSFYSETNNTSAFSEMPTRMLSPGSIQANHITKSKSPWWVCSMWGDLHNLTLVP